MIYLLIFFRLLFFPYHNINNFLYTNKSLYEIEEVEEWEQMGEIFTLGVYL